MEGNDKWQRHSKIQVLSRTYNGNVRFFRLVNECVHLTIAIYVNMKTTDLYLHDILLSEKLESFSDIFT